jgi:hypothetical protein
MPYMLCIIIYSDLFDSTVSRVSVSIHLVQENLYSDHQTVNHFCIAIGRAIPIVNTQPFGLVSLTTRSTHHGQSKIHQVLEEESYQGKEEVVQRHEDHTHMVPLGEIQATLDRTCHHVAMCVSPRIISVEHRLAPQCRAIASLSPGNSTNGTQ